MKWSSGRSRFISVVESTSPTAVSSEPAAHLRDRALQHLQVHLETHRRDRAVLLGAEQVAGAADLEVAKGDLETLPELVQPGDDVQPLVRLLGQRAARVVEEVGVRAPPGPADAAPQLIELRQPEAVGALDDDRVDVRDVEARLDDRRAHEHVELRGLELDHHVRELVLRPSGRAR